MSAPPRFLYVVCACLLLGSCSKDLAPASHLVDHPLVKDTSRYPFDGVWTNPDAKDYDKLTKGVLYVAPVDVSLIEKKFPKEAPILAKSFHLALEREVLKALSVISKARSGREWKLSQLPIPGCLTFEFAIVKLKTTKGYLNSLGFIGGFFSPVPGTGSVISHFASGGIGIEGRLVDASYKKTLMCFKDGSDDPMTLFSTGDFGKFGHSEDALDIWAREIGASISTPYTQKIKKIHPSLIDLRKPR